MSFDLQTWKRQAGAKLRQIGRWLPRRADAVNLTYGTLCGLSLWPLVEAARAGQLMPVVLALGGVAGGVGGNLIAEQIQRWQSRAVDEDEVHRWVAQHASNPELRAALDAILERLEAVQQAQEGLGQADRQWFVDTLQQEMQRLGNLERFEAVLVGPGAIAQDHSAAATLGGVAVGGDVKGDVLAPGASKTEYHLPDPTQAQTDRARSRYLTHLLRHCNALPLAALGGEPGADEDVSLEDVYIALDTRTQVPLDDAEKAKRSERLALEGRGESRPLPALQAAARERRLVLLGDPGGGKSTFVRKLLGWAAARQLGENVQDPPGDTGQLLPVLVTLRDLSPRLRQLDPDALAGERRRVELAHLLRDHLQESLERLEAGDFDQGLVEALSSGCCLVALDGLDEIPQALRRRARLLIQAFIKHYAPARVLVTCRVRSYGDADALPNFQSHVLAPFDEEKIRRFAEAWYDVQHRLGRVDAIEARDKAADLARAALGEGLKELASNPMLLTTMAIIHQQEIGLPQQRVRLYDLAVDVLLRRWHKHKVGADAPALSDELAALLGDERKLRRIVELLAYEAHSQGQGAEQAVDLERTEALRLLEAPACLDDVGLADQFLDYVDRRAGLLVGRGGGEGKPAAYSFPHRTFQEYLAGCYVVGQRDASRELWRRARQGDDWALAAQLGAEELLYNRRNDFGLLDLAYRLCPVSAPDGEPAWRAALWSGLMAALLGRSFVAGDDAPDGGSRYLERLLARLVQLLQGQRLGAPERAEAGRALAWLGDPRLGVLTLADAAFCLVPPGPFWMGSTDEDEGAYSDEKPQRQVDVPYAYWMARYPVTVAQFEEFVQAGGYSERRYWEEAQAAGVWRADGSVKGFFDNEPRVRPYDYGVPFNLPNHPVVGMMWYEALAFTRWLTEHWRKEGLLSIP